MAFADLPKYRDGLTATWMGHIFDRVCREHGIEHRLIKPYHHEVRWPMKICVFGAGAIGGYLAVELSLAGHEVSVIARGDHLAAIQARGLTLRIGGHVRTARVRASAGPSEFGPQDYVLCALKAHQAYEVANAFAPLLGPGTAVVTAMNGIPWWYFYKHGGPLEGCNLQSVDPGGRQWTLIGPERAIGCVVDPACEVIEPGVIEHHEFNRFTLGEPDGSQSLRVEALSQAMNEAGFDAPVREDIRWNVWLKLWGNVCFNPISSLTHATLDRITGRPSLRGLCTRVMHEAKAVSDALGVHIDESMIERRLTAAGKAVGHKMSMLQDLERGRSMEIDALVTVVQEVGRLTGVATPTIDLLLTLVQERALQAGLYESPYASA
jgi:2-dehydropantoate 2-reductase